MIKHIISTLTIIASLTFCLYAQPEPTQTQNTGHTVSEVLQLIKGEWRQQYKIIDGQIYYDRKYRTTSTGMKLAIDTSAIHIFSIDSRGRTNYILNWEETPGNLKFDRGETAEGSWDLRQLSSGVELTIRDAYFKGCPDLKRRVSRINSKQLLLFDPETGDNYYFTRR